MESDALALLAVAKTLYSEQADLKTRLTNAQSELQSLESKFPQVADEAVILTQLSELARRSDVRLHEIYPESPMQIDNYRLMKLQLKGSGAYESVCRFLHGLDSLEHGYRLSDWTLSGPGNSNGDCTISLSLELVFAPELQTTA